MFAAEQRTFTSIPLDFIVRGDPARMAWEGEAGRKVGVVMRFKAATLLDLTNQEAP